jgi:hypothetical protein
VQKLWLKNFEFQISPNTWNAAQDLVLAGGIRSLQEVEKHFWVATVVDGTVQYEVETIITPNKIKAFTCECWAEGRRLMCPHIAAALFKIRQFLEQKAEARQAKVQTEQHEKSSRLTVQNVLENAPPDELSAFVRAYSRRDRDFALALKTWFAGTFTDSENPYLLVLDAALPRHAASRALQTPEVRRLRNTLDDLENQLKNAANAVNAPLVFQISTAVLQKTTPLLAKLGEQRQEQLLQYCRVAVQHLIQLSAEHLAPDLREKRRTFLLDYLTRWACPAALERIIMPFLAQAAADDAFFLDIRNLFDRTPFPAPPVLLHLFLAALAQRKRPEGAARVLQDYADRPAQARDAIFTLYQLHYWEAALSSGEYFLEKNLLTAGHRREVEDILLAAAEKAGDRPRHTAYLRQRYRQYGNESVLERLKILAGPDWPEEQKRLLTELRAAGDDAKIAPLLAGAGDLDALAAHLEHQHDLTSLRPYEHLFWPARIAFVRDYYVSRLSEHLSEHFGKQAAEYIRDQLAGLLRKGQNALAGEIVAALIARFPDRQALPEELAEMFPKTKRNPLF